MCRRVKNPDDVAIGNNRVGNRQFAVKQLADGLRNDRLAIARRAVDENRVAAVDRRTELIEHALAEHQVSKRVPVTVSITMPASV